MYLVSEVKKRTRKGGKGHCQVYHVSNLKQQPSDVTEEVAKKFSFKTKGGSIIIHYGTGTGYERIKKSFLELDPQEVVQNVSVFYQ